MAAVLVSSAQGQNPVLFPIQREAKTGFIDRQGNVVIAPQFDRSGESFNLRKEYFSEGLQPVSQLYEHWGYIDGRGVVVIPLKFTLAKQFSEDLAAVSVFAGGSGYIDHSGQFVLAPVYYEAGPFSEGLAAVTGHDKAGYIDKVGAFVVEFPLSAQMLPFSEGLAAVLESASPYAEGGRGLWGFIDKKGTWAIPQRYEMVTPFRDGLALVLEDGEFNFIDHSGKVVAGPFDQAWEFSEGLALVQLNSGQPAFINREGEVQFKLAPNITGVEQFSGGLAMATVLTEPGGVEQTGYINRSGRFVIPPIYSAGSSFLNGLASVAIRGQTGYIDQTGQIVWGITPQTKFAQRLAPSSRALTPERIAEITGYTDTLSIKLSKEPGANSFLGTPIWSLAVKPSNPMTPALTINLLEGGTFLSDETIGTQRAIAKQLSRLGDVFRPIGPNEKPIGYALNLLYLPSEAGTNAQGYGASIFSADRQFEVLVTVRQGDKIRKLDDPLGWVSKVALEVSEVLFEAITP